MRRPEGRSPEILVGLAKSIFVLLCIVTLAPLGMAQSTDPEFPSPLWQNDITGTITPRDIGDARLTRHYYIFNGTPGDLTVTVESRNLDGDIDLFAAAGLRPLAKITMYAGESASSTSKTIYLKVRQPIVLRVEARSSGDENGTYHVRFSGSFAAANPDTPEPPEAVTAAASSGNNRQGRRVSSSGARIAEPEPTPSPTPVVASSEPVAPAGETSSESTAAPPAEAAATPKPSPQPRAASRRPVRTRSSRRAPPPRPQPSPSPSESQAATTPESSTPVPTPGNASPSESAKDPAASGPRLIVEFRDGTHLTRLMSTVRRVTVEGNSLVIVTRDGKIIRGEMGSVLRIAIEP